MLVLPPCMSKKSILNIGLQRSHLRDVCCPAGEAHDAHLLVERVVADVDLAGGAQDGVREEGHQARGLHHCLGVVDGELVGRVRADRR